MIRLCLLTFSFLLIYLTPLSDQSSVYGQETGQEVFLQFRYQNVVNVYVSSQYEQDEFFLSVNELFSALQIDITVDQANFTISGNYLGEGNYLIDFNNRRAVFQDRELSLSADDYIISDLGFYLHPDILNELLGLEFVIDFNNLAVTLETDNTMPVIAQRERERRRERLLRTQRELQRSFDPLRFDRVPKKFDGGFLDYNITANISETNSYLFSTNLGTEIMGGDFQGTVFGSTSQTSSSIRSSGLRWRYGILNNDLISTITAGQTTSDGILPVAYTGLKLSNEPIEPRYLYGETSFAGTTEPNAEVELYRNNTLVDFTQSDGSGSYRFVVPLTYGSSQYSVRIYSPTGEITEREARLQIPFNFLPPGEINYNIDAGRLDNPISGTTDRGFLTNLNASAGFTNWLTTFAGFEYFENFNNDIPTVRGGVSSRFLTNYLINLEAASNAFYRASASVIYPSNTSINLDYTYFNTQGGIYNPGRNLSSLRLNLFTPFQLGSLPLFLRWSFSNEERENSTISRYRLDLNSRLGRANIRLGYRDSQIGRISLSPSNTARINSSVTYNFSRSRLTPSLLRGIFARVQMNYIPSISEIEDVDFQISRNILNRGRVQVSAGRNFLGDFNLFQFSLTFDFNAVRTNTSIRSSRNSSTFTQSVRGSAGFDSNHDKVILSNRQQAGRSAVAVRMFVDNSGTGSYDPETDEIIPENAIRIDRAGGNIINREGITYISQLQPYRQYNMSVNKGSVNNPLLVPELERFSIITDPNQYKLIEIPFYMSGIIDGMVNRETETGKEGLGGMRLFLNQVNTAEGVVPYSEEIRTFSDGSFYAYEIPPGDYQLEPDPSQLNFLNSVSEPEILDFTVRSLAMGDFVEGLEIVITPESGSPDIPDEPVAETTVFEYYNIVTEDLPEISCMYSFEIGAYFNFSETMNAADELAANTGLPFDLSYNSQTSEYTVQSSQLFTVSNLEGALELIKPYVEPDQISLLSECSEEIEETLQSTEPVSYSIRLRSFDDESTAAEYSEQLARDNSVETMIEFDPQQSEYNVVTIPITDQQTLLDLTDKLSDVSGTENLTIEESEEESDTLSTSGYSLKLGEFETPDLAASYLDSVNSTFGIDAKIIRMDTGRYNVVTDEQQNLDTLNELRETIRSTEGFNYPIIFKSATSDGEQTVSNESSADHQRPAVDIPVADTPNLPENITIRQFLENSGISEGLDVKNCSFPVQIGSYEQRIYAITLAERFSNQYQTEISLFFNENTDLYALRTESYSTIAEAIFQIETFRSIDPYNEFALVGQCSYKQQEERPLVVRYVIPLIRYYNESQAQQFVNDTKSGLNLPTVVRSVNNGQYFSVYAGPYENYEEALIAKEIISESGLTDNPVTILDPESRNLFDFQFQLHLGMYGNPKTAVETTKQIENQTGRKVEASTDTFNYVHLSDSESFTSWSEFLEFVRRINIYRNLNISYLIIE